MTNLPVKRLLS